MTTSASLDTTSLRLSPGEEAVVPLQVRNNGEIVEGYWVEVLGPTAQWATVEPESFSLYPGATTTATVTFRPPRASGVLAGEQQFGVKVTPTEHPEHAVVPEGMVEVLPFYDTFAELLPRTSQGRRRAKHEVAIDNRGNVPVRVLLSPGEDGNKLSLTSKPETVTINPGEAQFGQVTVKAPKRIWRGSPITHPFAVAVEPQDSEPVRLDGTFVQQPTFPKWLPKALLAALALLALLAALWFLLLKPTIESAATESAEDAVKDDVAAVKDDSKKAEEAAKNSQKNAGETEKDKEEVKDNLGIDKLPPNTVVSPFSERLNVTTAGTDSEVLEVPDRTVFEITDLVLSNPQGDFGRMVIRINDEVKYDFALENFRDLDFHYITPITLGEDQEISIEVRCNVPGEPPGAPKPTECDGAMYLGGESTETLPPDNSTTQ